MKASPETEAWTPEKLERMGQEFMETFLRRAPPELLLQYLSSRQRLIDLNADQVRELLQSVPPEQRLAGLDPEQRLAGLDPETIRRYLERLEQQDKKH